MPVNLENEKKKNIRLAIGVASLGIVGFIVTYILLSVIIVFSPWTFLELFPFPSFIKEVADLGGNLLIFSETLDFKGATYEEPPKEKTTLRIYNGESISAHEDVKPFSSLYATQDKIYFFNRGLFRTFDGMKWEEFKTSEIGSSPKGAVGTGGIWVLSTIRKKPLLELITEKEVREVPLPDDDMVEEMHVCSSQLLCLGDELHLFFENNDGLVWYRYDGERWDQPVVFENSTEYKALLFQDGILLTNVRNIGTHSEIALRGYRENFWSEPEMFTIRGTAFNTKPAVFRGRPIIFRQGFFSEKYYFLDGGKVEGPYSIGKPFFLSGNLWEAGIIALSLNMIFLILVFLLSLLVRKFKLKTWIIDSREYEFASLFRRFLAKYIDFLVISIPPGIPLYFALKDDMIFDNPFMFMALFLALMGIMLLGSFLYHSLLEGLWGKTIGKKICGIIVLKDDFTKCTIGRGFLRNVMRIVDSFFYYLVAAVSMAGTMKWQRLGDIVAGTVVVRDKRR